MDFLFAGIGIFWLLALVAQVFVLWMIIEALVYEPTVAEKLLWFLVIFFLNIVGAVVYFIVRRPARGRVGSPMV